jgi:hypothetical protein
LGVVANNPDEQAIRAEYLLNHPDKFEAIAYFSEILARSLRSGVALTDLFEQKNHFLTAI